jgi:pimeloyl-ACP methyl ester carboxylesterase
MTDHFDAKPEKDIQPILPIEQVWLLHGKGGSPEGSVKKLETVLAQHWPGLDFQRPRLPHNDTISLAEASVEYLRDQHISKNSLLVGISLGGLVAAKLQEVGRPDLQVMAISSPTWADGIALGPPPGMRLAFYSSNDSVINQRTGEWPDRATMARDLPWLNHDTDRHLKYIARLFDWYIEGMLSERIDNVHGKSLTRQEMDEIVWRNMAQPRRPEGTWVEGGWRGGRPRDFAEVGEAVQAGRSWDGAWGDWLHEFVYRKDARCLAFEPSQRFSAERRAMMAGAAEFFARLYGLPKPAWVEKPEYFLAEPEFASFLASDPDDPEFIVWIPDSYAALWRLQARSPKEMLRRNVIFEARSLTVL